MKAKGIYSITNLNDGQHTTYIGSTIQSFKIRWGVHRSALRHGRHVNSHLQRAWDKYGEDAFAFAIVEVVDDVEKVVGRERIWLDFYRMYVPVYNLSTVIGEEGYLGHPHNEVTKERIRRANSGDRHYMYGKKHSRETKKRLSEALSGANNPFYGRKHSLATKRKQSEAKRGKNNPFYGREFSDEHRKNLANSKAKDYPAFENVKTGEIIPPGKNLLKLCRERGFSYASMLGLARGRQKSSGGGVWILSGGREC